MLVMFRRFLLFVLIFFTFAKFFFLSVISFCICRFFIGLLVVFCSSFPVLLRSRSVLLENDYCALREGTSAWQNEYGAL